MPVAVYSVVPLLSACHCWLIKPEALSGGSHWRLFSRPLFGIVAWVLPICLGGAVGTRHHRRFSSFRFFDGCFPASLVRSACVVFCCNVAWQNFLSWQHFSRRLFGWGKCGWGSFVSEGIPGTFALTECPAHYTQHKSVGRIELSHFTNLHYFLMRKNFSNLACAAQQFFSICFCRSSGEEYMTYMLAEKVFLGEICLL